MPAPGLVPDGAAVVVICALATRFVGQRDLAPFYRQFAAMFGPGGWPVNLDHMAVSEP